MPIREIDWLVVRFDLQSHSTHSDGALAPAEVVRRAAAAGIELLALSDHDTVDGIDEALAAAREVAITLVPAVEISVVDAAQEDLHILGYGIDHHDPALVRALALYRADRARRAESMAAALREAGLELEQGPLEARRAADRSIGRPHLAQAAIEHPANARRLADEGLRTRTDVLVAYLIPGAPAYCAREHPTVAEAIAAIHGAGGIAVWAHPFWDIEDPDAVLAAVERFVGDGLDGIEAFYVTHSEAQTCLLHETCARHGLQTTGSADYHGPAHSHFSRFGAFDLHGLEPRARPAGRRRRQRFGPCPAPCPRRDRAGLTAQGRKASSEPRGPSAASGADRHQLPAVAIKRVRARRRRARRGRPRRRPRRRTRRDGG